MSESEGKKMKKMKNTRYATIARSNYPQLDELEDQIKAQQARLDAMIARIKKMEK